MEGKEVISVFFYWLKSILATIVRLCEIIEHFDLWIVYNKTVNLGEMDSARLKEDGRL